MDRTAHKKWIPFCPTQIPQVDQYSFPIKDPGEYYCHNGVTYPIYDSDGNISYTLPLDMYPKVNSIHPQVLRSKTPRFPNQEDNRPYIVDMRPYQGLYQH
jgi:hypothetical protein